MIAFDEHGAFVSDLSVQDLQVLEDRRPQEISSFRLVTVPDPKTAAILPTTASISPTDRRVAAMTARQLEQLEGRIYMLVVDDFHIGVTDRLRTRMVLESFVRSHMGANDAAALVYTSGARGLDFTQDRAALLKSITRMRGSLSGEPDGVRELKARTTAKTIAQLATDLEKIEGRRKALLLATPFIGCGIAQNVLREHDQRFTTTQEGTGSAARDQSQAFEGNGPGARPLTTFTCASSIMAGIASAVHSNTTIYAIDPRGLNVPDFAPAEIDGRGGPGSAVRRAEALAGNNNSIADAMFPLATDTGGFVVTRTNAFEPALDRIVREQSSYYLVGYYSTNPVHDGKRRNTKIVVTRKGVSLTYRPTYFAPVR